MFNRENLIKIMRERSLSLAEVSKRCGIAYSTLRDLYTGKNKNPLANTLKKLSDGLEINANCFIDEGNSIEQKKHKKEEFDEETRAIARNIKNLSSDNKSLLTKLIKTMSEEGDNALK